MTKEVALADGPPIQQQRFSIGERAFVGWLQVGLVAVALLFCFRGKGQHLWWILLASGLPLLRLSLSVAYRERLLCWLRGLWGCLEAFPVQQENIPWLATFILVVLPTALLSLSANFGIVAGDSRPVVLTAASLVTEGDLNLRWYFEARERDLGVPLPQLVEEHSFVQYTRSGIHSSYPAGMVPFAVPVVAAARVLGANLADPQVQWRLEKWTASWVSGACVGLFLLLALHVVSPKPAWIASLMLATGSVLFSTVGQGLWQHGGVIFWGLAALLIEFRQCSRVTTTASVLQGLALGQMFVCRLSTALFILPFGFWVLWRAPKRALLVGVFGLLGYMPWAMLYHSIYGTFFGPSTGQMAGSLWSLAIWHHLAAVLFSPARGLFVYQPWLLLGVVALLPLFFTTRSAGDRSRLPAGWIPFCLVVIVLHLCLVSGWRCWWGGSCWGSRLAADVIPLAALLCLRPIATLWLTRNGRLALGVLALVSFLMQVPGVYLSGGKWNYYSTEAKMLSWSNPPFLAPFGPNAVGQPPGSDRAGTPQ